MYQLFIRQKVFKIRDKYPVLDAAGNEIYFVEQDFKLIGNTIHARRSDGSRSFVIDRRLLHLLPNYDVNFSDGTEMLIKQRFALFRKVVDVISEEMELKLEGDIFGFNFDIRDGGHLVGRINRKWLSWGDTFVIDVLESRYEDELLALLIVIDDIIDQEEARNND